MGEVWGRSGGGLGEVWGELRDGGRGLHQGAYCDDLALSWLRVEVVVLISNIRALSHTWDMGCRFLDRSPLITKLAMDQTPRHPPPANAIPVHSPPS